ncbi:NAD(P)-dependent oxidoreductase [Jiangella mangrovi]|uniref:3-hydroxyisobutyrate dehydrogenase-like beta-hydroxyacid dehydrogenase n=1 Tax=Jiangella mangrovi TaxID=1524084 RepID=A0A7W9GS84_9ACTN|nr:NAD(P)-binding domain-containing protein [Jiangella mangrovi]MBB5789092.1 3-hydroxyisobutyrate dehydrogenase-like beta-hydroxyacid dehydrogenase [Jiangella mangrovi]
MTDHQPAPVTVLGLGSMGSALARAFLAAGHPTTVWNRTPSKAAPLVAEGARHTTAVDDAVAASPLVIACLTGYDDTRAVLESTTASWAGRVLVTLNSGTPTGARGMAAWAAEQGIRFLDGAVKDVPDAVGKAGTLLYYAGDPEGFAEHAATLRALGGDTVLLGDEPDLAKFYESAVGATLLPALVGFFAGAAAARNRGIPASELVPYSVRWLTMIGEILPLFAAEIDARDYSAGASSVDLFLTGADWDLEFARDAGIDDAWLRPLHDLIRRAGAAGHGPDSIAALTEVIRVP